MARHILEGILRRLEGIIPIDSELGRRAAAIILGLVIVIVIMLVLLLLSPFLIGLLSIYGVFTTDNPVLRWGLLLFITFPYSLLLVNRFRKKRPAKKSTGPFERSTRTHD